ncbi:EF-hand domain-containing protein [Pseudoalteromonas sp. MMG010]|uniref:EF-hand domain-containing protein n=1 Tax=Pseudoalteromonas sp. MMG010 TaxID=2822685 RepID=UPI001B3A4EB2|nr:EF-hand domain-containing protein [Pseudoalteromonas sp. MMG010]MBQ4832559.1 EF-hand domain-containing protein [Pseudoalteromonas sp. MMG010]
MKTLTLASAILASLSLAACASHPKPEQIDSTFGSLDNDHDGFISKVEADDDNIWQHFSKIDTNYDEQISRTEFNQYMQAFTGQVAEDSEVSESAFKAEITRFDKIESSFSSLDNDSDGYVSVEEADDDDIANHFGYMDKNQDKRISKKEFVRYIKKNGSAVAEDEALSSVNS